MHKIGVAILMIIGIIISCGLGAAIGAIAGAILLPVKIFNTLSSDSLGKSSDKI